MSDIDFQTQLFTLVHDVASLTFLSYLIQKKKKKKKIIKIKKKACRLN